MQMLSQVAKQENFSLRTQISKLTEEQLNLILYGSNGKKYDLTYKGPDGREMEMKREFEGVIPNLTRRYQQTDSEYIRSEIEEYMNDLPCPECSGARLKKESLAVTIAGLNILDVTNISIKDAKTWIDSLAVDTVPEIDTTSTLETLLKFEKIQATEDMPSPTEQEIAKQIFKEISARLNFLVSVGLNYLTLSRKANSLSGGEAQRIRLASQIGTGLTGVLYVLDEPSIGLHQRDNDKLLGTLRNLRDIGNSVLVVEHDEDTIRSADYVIDIGPGAGEHGGKIVAVGQIDNIIKEASSITGKYLSGERSITKKTISEDLESIGMKNERVVNKNFLSFSGVSHHNLKNIDVEIPLGKLVAVTGVSGSGKSSLVNDVIYAYLAKELNRAKTNPGHFTQVRGVEHIDKVIDIDQSPIGRTPRSNPATYTGVFTSIRDIYAMTQESKARGYKPGRFSFNVRGGRCENCQGDGLIKIEMQFLPDVYVTCEVCHGKRYNRETLQVDYKGKNIAEVLEMTVEDGLEFFKNIPAIAQKLQTLNDVGLGYIRLGQAATTLSGGEAQRVKLASELAKRQTGKTLYILDEPTTGLHFEDVRRLLVVLHGLVAKGNSILVIEHNLDVIKTADHVIDLGPEGGEEGGYIIAEGTPEHIAEVDESYTGQWLRKVI
jgi:excinuclease ABC subunit A